MVIFLGLERVIPYKSYSFVNKGFYLDLFWYLLTQGLVLQYLVFDYVDKMFTANSLNAISSLPFYLQVPLLILAIEFITYWYHRWNHSWLPMWRIHEVHHSSLELNVLSANRAHIFQILFINLISGATLALLGVSQIALIIYLAWDAIMGMFTHSNLKVNVGRLKYIINCPEMHRIHHLDVERYQRSNFGDKLSLWDWVFGTAILIDSEEMEQSKFGLGYEYPQNVIGQVFYMFRPIKNKELDKP